MPMLEILCYHSAQKEIDTSLLVCHIPQLYNLVRTAAWVTYYQMFLVGNLPILLIVYQQTKQFSLVIFWRRRTLFWSCHLLQYLHANLNATFNLFCVSIFMCSLFFYYSLSFDDRSVLPAEPGCSCGRSILRPDDTPSITDSALQVYSCHPLAYKKCNECRFLLGYNHSIMQKVALIKWLMICGIFFYISKLQWTYFNPL